VIPKGSLFQAAVLVPVVISGPVPALVFTQRTETVETHKGQVSFPGGMVEESDRDIVYTAIREGFEEIGLMEADLDVVGLLDDLATPTGFIITPVVVLARPSVPFRPNADEVAGVFEVPLAFFADPANGRMEYLMVEGRQREVWHYTTEGHTIWGATAAIVRSLLRVLGLL
jgi:8-oxo-dGTP pyrophosphatase MutT (NUDIX family)